MSTSEPTICLGGVCLSGLMFVGVKLEKRGYAGVYVHIANISFNIGVRHDLDVVPREPVYDKPIDLSVSIPHHVSKSFWDGLQGSSSSTTTTNSKALMVICLSMPDSRHCLCEPVSGIKTSLQPPPPPGRQRFVEDSEHANSQDANYW